MYALPAAAGYVIRVKWCGTCNTVTRDEPSLRWTCVIQVSIRFESRKTGLGDGCGLELDAEGGLHDRLTFSWRPREAQEERLWRTSRGPGKADSQCPDPEVDGGVGGGTWDIWGTAR